MLRKFILFAGLVVETRNYFFGGEAIITWEVMCVWALMCFQDRLTQNLGLCKCRFPRVRQAEKQSPRRDPELPAPAPERLQHTLKIRLPAGKTDRWARGSSSPGICLSFWNSVNRCTWSRWYLMTLQFSTTFRQTNNKNHYFFYT